MKTAIIIHGMPDEEEYLKDPNRLSIENQHWLYWIKKELTEKNIIAETPTMPVPYLPEYSAWKEMFETFPLTQETILIGHSCGGGFIVRYLSENNIRVGKVVLVAPWLNPEHFLKNGMFDFTIDENIVDKTSGITIFNSTNDDIEIQESVKLITDKAAHIKLVEFENLGHFRYDDMHTDAFPELLIEATS
ncbi:MAG: alpha/beta hydrolase [Candidatus Pacebacteria bacterium]|jgi:predicted alpha/beta hydrolase family esterase|nr:alpha/beta hydrolase [Candidatus Paceibacterota bacterium]